MAANVTEFISRLSGGGARANQFEVEIFMSSFITDTETIKFLCRSASLPAMTIGEVPVFYRGRQIYLSGDRTYADWTVTVYNDANWISRGNLENWNNSITEIGATSSGSQSPADYYGLAYVRQKDRSDNFIRTARLQDLWPTNLGEIALAYDTVDAIEEYEVTFRFNYMRLYGAKGPNLGSG